jgi:uncharacterized protein YoxC
MSMDDTQKMLRTIINGQSAMKSELLSEIRKGDEELGSEIKGLRKETKEGLKKVNRRLDLIGKQVAYLDDDAPTGEEHDELEKRVKKLEHKVVTS